MSDYRQIKVLATLLTFMVRKRFRPAAPDERSNALNTDKAVASVSAAEQFNLPPDAPLNAAETLACIELESMEGEEVRWEPRTESSLAEKVQGTLPL
jgi:hypothetical protein